MSNAILAQHTPGPWHITDDEIPGGKRLLQINSEFGHIAHVYGANYPDDETMPNASLIAAAPDLLAALRRAVEVLDADGIVYGECDDEPLDVLGAARAAIAKAEGA